MAAARTKTDKLSPVSQLRGVLTVLDGKTKTPTAELLGAIREMVGDALAVLQEPDPTKQRIAFVLLAIPLSTSVSTRTVRGKELHRVTVVDQPLYGWAIAEIHGMAGAA